MKWIAIEPDFDLEWLLFSNRYNNIWNEMESSQFILKIFNITFHKMGYWGLTGNLHDK